MPVGLIRYSPINLGRWLVWGGFALAMALTGWGLWQMAIEPAPASHVRPFLSTVTFGTSPCRTQQRWAVSPGFVQFEARPSTSHWWPVGSFTVSTRPSGPFAMA